MKAVDNRRTARLLLDAEILAGRLTEDDAVAPAVLAKGSRHPSGRLTARARMRLGWSDGVAVNLGPAVALRVAALNTDARSNPRFLLRVDEFPCAAESYDPERYGLETFRRFHELLSGADGLPYLLAVVPELAEDYFEPTALGGRDLSGDEVAVLHAVQERGVVLGQHGTTHRTMDRNPRRHSEFRGLSPVELASVLDRGRKKLADHGIRPRVFVPPFNRFDERHWGVLADRFDVVTGGPESIAVVGMQPGPVWLEGTVYLPCYPPLYGRAAAMIPVIERIIESQPGTWVPLVIHVAWERDDDFRELERLGELLRPYAASWEELLAAADRSAGREVASGSHS